MRKILFELEKIVWDGYGDKLFLKQQIMEKFRRFLDNVPHLLSLIKSIHIASINNDVELLKVKGILILN